MSNISVHPDEFADIVVAYLLDIIRDDDMMPDNERFQTFMKIMEARGLKLASYSAFIDMGTDTRIKYKRIKPALESKGTVRIEITKGETPYINEDFDRELCKQVFRKIKEVRYKHPSKVLTEDRIDKIIDYCVQQKKEKTNG